MTAPKSKWAPRFRGATKIPVWQIVVYEGQGVVGDVARVVTYYVADDDGRILFQEDMQADEDAADAERDFRQIVQMLVRSEEGAVSDSVAEAVRIAKTVAEKRGWS